MVQDKSQDYQLIVGYEYQDTTVVRFKRKVNTCDGEDLALTVSLIGPGMGFEPLTFFDISTLLLGTLSKPVPFS